MGVIVTEEQENIVIAVTPDEAHVIAATGGGSVQNYYRDCVNYDGGRAASKYGGMISLDGGGAADGRRYPV